jgi:hypothetical protein
MAKSKSVDRPKIVARLMKLLKKEFGGLPKRESLPCLETMVYGICLENSTFEAADAAYERLTSEFFDWNEIRVSTVTELEPVFEGLSEPHWRAQRIRHLLYYVFDHQYSWDFDGLKRKKLDLTTKQLSKIKYLPPFVCHYLMLVSLGTHALPVDDRMVKAAVWTGILPAGCDEESGAELLKSFIRKADCLEFFWYLKSLSVSPKAAFLEDWKPSIDEPGADISDAEERVGLILSGSAKRSAAASARKETVKKTVAAAAKKPAVAAKKTTASKAKKKTASPPKKTTATKAKKKTAAKAKKKTSAKPKKKTTTRSRGKR